MDGDVCVGVTTPDERKETPLVNNNGRTKRRRRTETDAGRGREGSTEVVRVRDRVRRGPSSMTVKSVKTVVGVHGERLGLKGGD